MPRQSKPPNYRRHKQSGKAIVTLTDGYGGRRDVLLGKYGTSGSRTEYARVIAEWEANGRRLRTVDPSGALTVNELTLAFWEHAETYYRRLDGTTTSELNDYKRSLRPLKFLYGPTLVKDVDALALQAVRQLMLDGYEHPKYGPQGSLARKVINQRVNRIRRMFRWGVARKLVPGSVCHELGAVDGLKAGRSVARETAAVAPVHETVVEATIPFVRPQVAAMIRLQLLTGMRPGEIAVMRRIDLDTTGQVWLYRPGSDRGATGQHWGRCCRFRMEPDHRWSQRNTPVALAPPPAADPCMDCTHTALLLIFAHTCKDRPPWILASARLFCVFGDSCKDRCPDLGHMAGSV
jgi:hypothetical protein